MTAEGGGEREAEPEDERKSGAKAGDKWMTRMWSHGFARDLLRSLTLHLRAERYGDSHTVKSLGDCSDPLMRHEQGPRFFW